MKKIIICLSVLILQLYNNAASAQNTDSLFRQTKRAYDSLAKLVYQNYVADTVLNRLVPVKTKSLQLKRQQDSLLKFKTMHMDSVKYRLYVSNRANVALDSLYRLTGIQYKLFDSVKSKNAKMRIMTNSVNLSKRYLRTYNDSLRKIYAVRFDNLHKFKLAQSYKLDSIRHKLDSARHKIILRKFSSDSLRMQKYLQQKKELYRLQHTDTVTMINGLRSRQLLTEVSCFEGDTVYINNSLKKVTVKIIPSQKVRLSSEIFYKETLEERDQELLKKMGIEISREQHHVTADINSRSLKLAGKTNNNCDDILQSEINLKRPLLIEIPATAVLVLHSKFADAEIEDYVKSLKAQLLHSNLTMCNAGTAAIDGTNATISTANLNDALLKLTASRFTGSNISSLQIVSSTSVLKLNDCSKMNMTSTGDEFTIYNAGSITGSKNFGKLQIDYLKEQLVLDGSGADIKVKNLKPGGPLIKIDGKFTDLKLPLYGQENFAVYYEGSYKDVNSVSYTANKITGDSKINATFSLLPDTLKESFNKNKTVFKAFAGNITDKHTKIDIVCPYCTVVFN